MKPGNAVSLFAMPDVDGGLIGGASLVADDFPGHLPFGGSGPTLDSPARQAASGARRRLDGLAEQPLLMIAQVITAPVSSSWCCFSTERVPT